MSLAIHTCCALKAYADGANIMRNFLKCRTSMLVSRFSYDNPIEQIPKLLKHSPIRANLYTSFGLYEVFDFNSTFADTTHMTLFNSLCESTNCNYVAAAEKNENQHWQK